MIDAVIFDMDGTLIDSEPMWKEAEKEVFSGLGVNVTEQLAQQSASMTTIEASAFWYSHNPWQGPSIQDVANRVVVRVGDLIAKHGVALDGVHNTLSLLDKNQIKIGLATNAPEQLIPIVLGKLGIAKYFSACCSSDNELEGKPHPAIYLSTARALNVCPSQCLAIEDSGTGVLAAKAANMRTLAVPHIDEYDHQKFDLSDFKLKSLSEFGLGHLA
ncbi:HAD family hydrolase [Pseudoalteromonas luteoviolacea]|uniref:HAD family hydrolase n=1 Tax=Pseudoalteromonas luteoviolacea TaxID=43657 RepID=A0A1C0TU15_9GAMM|nr:hexitol phosphatase HxpB [Pseudoalteromonas luteoviolacea]OCQ22802.1 HAD family hydrolase [Pseudoalteromonas luteoviolacea]